MGILRKYLYLLSWQSSKNYIWENWSASFQRVISQEFHHYNYQAMHICHGGGKVKSFDVWRTWNGQVKERTASWCKTPGSSLNLSAPSPGDLFLLTRMFFSQISAWLPSLPFLRVFALLPLLNLRLMLTTLFEIGNLHPPTYPLRIIPMSLPASQLSPLYLHIVTTWYL